MRVTSSVVLHLAPICVRRLCNARRIGGGNAARNFDRAQLGCYDWYERRANDSRDDRAIAAVCHGGIGAEQLGQKLDDDARARRQIAPGWPDGR